MSKRTPLYDLHLEHGAKMVDFAGWEMPIQYPNGIMTEHHQCRQKAAIFDVSHMGQVILKGEDIGRKLERFAHKPTPRSKRASALWVFHQ